MIQWNKALDKLPTIEGYYLAIAEDKRTKILKMQVLKYYHINASFNANGIKRWSHDGGINPKTIKYWAILPSFPKEL